MHLQTMLFFFILFPNFFFLILQIIHLFILHLRNSVLHGYRNIILNSLWYNTKINRNSTKKLIICLLIDSMIILGIFIMKQQEKDPQTLKQGKKRALQKQEEDEMIGPSTKKLQKTEYHDLLLSCLPSSDLYELSYMHRETVNSIVSCSKADFVITLSTDGHVKFWKKIYNLVEFSKNFKAHNGLITGASLSKNHDLFCTVGLDKTLKIFDVPNSDLLSAIKLNFVPSCCQFVPQKGRDWNLIAVGEEKTGKIWLIDPNYTEKGLESDNQDKLNGQQQDQGNKKQQQSHVVNTFSCHKHPIKFIKMNWDLEVCFSIDERAFLQVWDPTTLDFPTHLPYKCKIQTQFLQLLQAGSAPLSLSISPHGKYGAILLRDKLIRIFNLKTGKLVLTIAEDLKEINRIQQDQTHPLHLQLALQQHEFDRKLAVQKESEVARDFLFNPNIQFDDTQQFVIYASFHGLKFYSIANRKVEKILGKKQTDRFVRVSLFQGKSMRNPNGNANIYGQRRATDPLLICTAYKRPRFYMFSKRTPDLQGEEALIRDIVNERSNRQENQTINQLKMTQKQNQVVLQTTLGDIHFLLYLEDCPKTCENFIKLVKKSYYNGMIFHRVIKGFMNQTGCPKGDGTGGESIWGGMFEDELRPEKYRFDRPYVLAMANRGPNTNGSQFFITVVACPWLDNKHTIFGRVIKGIETVCQINKLKTDKGQKPINSVKIMSAKVV